MTRATSEAKQDHCQGVNAVGAVVLKTVFGVQPLWEKAQLTFLTQFLKKRYDFWNPKTLLRNVLGLKLPACQDREWECQIPNCLF